MPQPSTRLLGERAVVLGASLAGLLAARVLSERFAEVVLVERDRLPTGPAPRKGTPQAVHPHGLLARGRQVLEQLFPGFTEAMVARGGLLGDAQEDIGFDAGGRRFAAGRIGAPALAASRLAIEAEVRARVLARPGVRLLDGVDALAPAFAHGRVIGARWSAREGAAEPQCLAADLVLDCSGRGSRLPQWLQSWGCAMPAEERVDIGICYTSAYFERRGRCSFGPGLDRVAVFGAVTNEQPRPGVLIAQEPETGGPPRWVVGVGGFRGDHTPATFEAMRERAATIGAPELVKVLAEAVPVGEPMRYQVPFSLRRRYERLSCFPQRLLVMGDALTSFNPIYGQGMTVACCEALALADALDAGFEGLERRFLRAAARIVDTPWQLATGGDLSIDSVPGPRPLAVRLVNAYIGRLYRVAPHDAVVSTAFQKVVHLLEPPASLFAPAIVWRVLRGPREQPAPPAPATAHASRAGSIST